MDFIRSTSEKVKLWRVEHFFPPFFSRSMLIGGKFIFYKKIHYKICKCCNFNQSALIWKKTGEKSVQLVRVSLFWKYFLWNPYFRKASNLTFVCFQLAGWWHHPASWTQTNVSFPLLLAPQDFQTFLRHCWVSEVLILSASCIFLSSSHKEVLRNLQYVRTRQGLLLTIVHCC